MLKQPHIHYHQLTHTHTHTHTHTPFKCIHKVYKNQIYASAYTHTHTHTHTQTTHTDTYTNTKHTHTHTHTHTFFFLRAQVMGLEQSVLPKPSRLVSSISSGSFLLGSLNIASGMRPVWNPTMSHLGSLCHSHRNTLVFYGDVHVLQKEHHHHHHHHLPSLSLVLF